MKVSHDAAKLLDGIRSANGMTVAHADPQMPLVKELLRAGLIHESTYGATYTGYKETKRFKQRGPQARKTTDSATPTLVPTGSTSGLIPPKVTDDPRITKDRG